jgi:hypothetical protein
MGDTIVAALVSLLLAIPATSAEPLATEPCANVEAKALCGPSAADLPFKEKDKALDALLSCRELLYNCICSSPENANGMLPPSFCRDLVKGVGRAALRLQSFDARSLKSAVYAATHKETWNNTKLFALEYQKRLACLASGLEFSTVYARTGTTYSEMKNHDPHDPVIEVVDWINLRDAWEEINLAVSACRRFSSLSKVASIGTSEQRRANEEARAQEMRKVLACTFREEGELSRYNVLDKWPGCRCGYDPKKKIYTGVEIDGVCLRSFTEDLFADMPIDERVITAMRKFVANLKARAAPYEPTEIGINGCSFMRFENGPAVKELEAGDLIENKHISRHARSTACDIRYVKFEDGNGGQKLFDMDPKDDAASDLPFARALQKSLVQCPDPAKARACRQFLDNSVSFDLAWRRARHEMMHEEKAGEFYRNLEEGFWGKLNDKSPPETAAGHAKLTKKEWEQLKFGVIARNCLIDSGFMVYDPLLNDEHNNHFHVAVPSEAYSWAILSQDDPAVRGPSELEEVERRRKLIDMDRERIMGKYYLEALSPGPNSRD